MFDSRSKLGQWLIGTAPMALMAVGGYAAPAMAQSEAADAPSGLDLIIVTAQKREENVQDTPISIVVLGSDALDQRGVGSLNDLMNGSLPSLRILPFAGRASAVTIGMRGMVPVDATQVTRDPTVGIYLDGVYLGRVQGLGMELADIERVEVLRGPQGALFGRNTIGGAVSIVSRRPTGELGLDLRAGLANRDGRNIAAHMNLPEFANISIKVGAVYDGRDGWVENPLTQADVPANYTIGGQNYSFEDINHDFSEVERYGYRVAALFEPTDNLSFLYSFDWSRDNSTGGYWHINATTQTVVPSVFAARDTDRASVSRIGAPLLPSTQRAQGHSLTAEWDVSEALTVRSISGWRRLNSDQWDQDSGALSRWNSSTQGRLSFANLKQSQFSQELQLVGDVGDLQFVAGAYYFEEDGSDTATVFRTLTLNSAGSGATLRNPATTSNTVAGIPNQLQDRASEVEVRSKALFTQATWSPGALDNRLHLTFGGRFTDDSKRGGLTFVSGVPYANLPVNTRPSPFVFNSSRFDPTATVAFDFNEDINAYVKYGRAYRAGGANTRSSILRTFAEEELTSWEAGIKSDLFDRRARINIAAFMSRLSNAQVDFINPANPSATETLNVPESTKVNGAEVDVTLAPINGMTIGINYVFTDFNTRSLTNPFPPNALELINIANTPRHAVSASFDYDFGNTSVGRPRIHFGADNVGGYFSTSSPSTDPTRNSRAWLVNGRLTLSEIPLLAENFEIALWAKNLTNQTYQQTDITLPTGAGNNLTAFYNEPRTYGLEMRVRY